MPSSRLLPELSLSLGFLLGCLVYSRRVLGAAVAWSSALWFLAAKEALWLDRSKSLCFKLPNTLGLRRMVEYFYNLRPVFSFVFCFFFSIGAIQCALCAHVFQYRWRLKWLSDPLVWVQISWRCWNVCKTSDALLLEFFFFSLSKYILIICWCEISFYLGKVLTLSLKNCSLKKKLLSFWQVTDSHSKKLDLICP